MSGPRTAVLETPRLRLRPATLDDAAFALELVTDPEWLRFVGDRGVRDLEGARRYLRDGPAAARDDGLAAFVVELRDEARTPVGICGLFRRDALEHPDLGYALLASHRGRGYALEACRAVLADARERLGLARVHAIVDPTNERSIRVLERLGMRFERLVRLPGEPVELALYAGSP
jgi:RimJ/RimL family protein N-acetyltransferase